MGNLIAFGFDRSWAANESLKTLRNGTAVEGAFVVERTASGRCIIRNWPDHGAAEAVSPTVEKLWGAMTRVVFLNSSLDRAIPRGGSGLFLLLDSAGENRTLKAVKPYKPRVLKTSLSREAEQRLKAELARAA